MVLVKLFWSSCSILCEDFEFELITSLSQNRCLNLSFLKYIFIWTIQRSWHISRALEMVQYVIIVILNIFQLWLKECYHAMYMHHGLIHYCIETNVQWRSTDWLVWLSISFRMEMESPCSGYINVVTLNAPTLLFCYLQNKM